MNLEKVRKINYNLRTYLIYGTVRGLLSEKNEIEEIFKNNNFDLVMLGISPEDLNGLSIYIEKPFEAELSDYEIIYGLKLQNFGKVKMPVPSFTTALKIALDKGIEVSAIDMNEKEYADAYTRNVKFLNLLRHTLRKKRLYKKEFKANSPEEFVLKWDREILKIKGYAKLENEREIYMANKIKNNEKGKNIIIIIDFERMEGVVKNIIGEMYER